VLYGFYAGKEELIDHEEEFPRKSNLPVIKFLKKGHGNCA
jgi:hypothetical protein